MFFFTAGASAKGSKGSNGKKSRKPASVSPAVSKTGVPLLPDGTPDYSRFPNPFVVKKWTIDLGGATGVSPAGDRYSEYSLGLNTYFYSWLSWRNVLFMRPESGAAAEPIYGFETSERMSYEFFSGPRLAVFASPGFRFAGGRETAPFAEAGISLRVGGGFLLSSGARVLLGSWVTTGGANQTQVFIDMSVLGWK
jgi:hypothetical protein